MKVEMKLEVEVNEEVENPEKVAWGELSGIIENAMFNGYKLGEIKHLNSKKIESEASK